MFGAHPSGRGDENSELQRNLAVESFKAARAEISDRIRLRDQTLAAYLAAVVSIVAFVLTAKADHPPVPLPSLLLFIPALTFAAAKVIADNHNMVNALAQYQQFELCTWIEAMGGDANRSVLPLWEQSKFLLKHQAKPPFPWRFARRLNIGCDEVAMTDIVVIEGPAVAALAIYDLGSQTIGRSGWIGIGVGIGLLLWSAWLLRRAALNRIDRRRAGGRPSA